MAQQIFNLLWCLPTGQEMMIDSPTIRTHLEVQCGSGLKGITFMTRSNMRWMFDVNAFKISVLVRALIFFVFVPLSKMTTALLMTEIWEMKSSDVIPSSSLLDLGISQNVICGHSSMKYMIISQDRGLDWGYNYCVVGFFLVLVFYLVLNVL